MKTMESARRRMLAGCFAAYFAAYIGRLNMSAALPALTDALSLTDAQGGALQTAFAVVYAAGQLINGAIVDRISARLYIVIGLCGSALCNVLFGMTDSYALLLALWALNGAAQSMLWTPIVKLIAGWYSGEQRDRVSIALSVTLIFGHMAAWALSTLAANNVGWRGSFTIPGFVALGAAAFALITIRDAYNSNAATTDKTSTSENEACSNVSPHKAMPLGTLFLRTGFIGVAVCGIANGFVRDGIITWSPTILSELPDSALHLSPLQLTLTIPVLNLCGVLVGRYCLRTFGSRPRGITARMTLAGTALCAGLCAISGFGLFATGACPAPVCAALLGFSCACVYGVNPLLTALIPMQYTDANRVALTAGLIDCFIYLGSALSGVVCGAIRDMSTDTVLFGLWAGLCLAGALCMAVARNGEFK